MTERGPDRSRFLDEQVQLLYAVAGHDDASRLPPDAAAVGAVNGVALQQLDDTTVLLVQNSCMQHEAFTGAGGIARPAESGVAPARVRRGAIGDRHRLGHPLRD
jgi:hypothetical protein